LTAAPGAVRPTIRCLREDLGHAKLPPASLPLDRLDLPVLRKAQEVCRTDPPTTGRITSIDDQVLWKVKIERWRGAVWCRPVSSPGRTCLVEPSGSRQAQRSPPRGFQREVSSTFC
jgi:hypothetical protein